MSNRNFRKFTTVIFTAAIASIPFAALAQASTQVNAGFKIPDQYLQSINKLQVVETTYTGECPGEKMDSEKVVFFSNQTPTADDRRVIISNVTGGEGADVNLDFQPFTDREYEDEAGSEKIKITVGNKHEDGKLVMMEGLNKFKYEIIQLDEDDEDTETVLETGYFEATVERLREEKNRSGTTVADEIGDKTYFRTQCPW